MTQLPSYRPGATGLASHYIPTLDGWRGVAILAVILCHSRFSLFSPGSLWDSPRLFSFAAEGRLGVDLFFAISGFLITGRLLAEADRDGRFSLSQFYIRRSFRILPPCWLYLSVLAVAGSAGQLLVSQSEIWDCLLFIRNYTLPAEGFYTGHFWSLAVEEHFYLLWPLLLLAGTRHRLVRIVPVLCLIVHVWRALDVRYHLFAVFFPDSGIGFRTDTRIDALLWGCEAALLMPVFERLRSRSWLSGSWAILTGGLIMLIAFPVPLFPLWLALLLPLMVVSTVLFPASLGGRVLEWSPLRWVGRMSYSLYLWQTLFLISTNAVDPFFHLPILKVWPWNLIMLFGIAWLSYRFVEKPMIRLGKRLTGRSKLGNPLSGPKTI